jgi:hypothetical protein
LPDTVYYPLYFADQDFKKPNRKKYMEYLEKYKPHMATVVDWEKPGQLDEVISWAKEAARFVSEIIIIPKVMGGIGDIPERVGGKPVRLGYSVPTKYGGTENPVWEFGDRPVHLLGGSPQQQMQIATYMNVRSVDGNQAQMMAVRYCQFWMPGTAKYARNRFWPTLVEAGDGIKWEGENAHHEAFRRSCKNIMEEWNRIL